MITSRILSNLLVMARKTIIDAYIANTNNEVKFPITSDNFSPFEQLSKDF